MWRKTAKEKRQYLYFRILAFFFAVRTGLEPATLGVTGRYSNQTELPHQKFRCKDKSNFDFDKIFLTLEFFFNQT